MANENYLAKKRFDDGTKKGVDGKPCSYKKGEKYLGKGNDLKAVLAKGLICTKKEFEVKDEIIDEKDRRIQELQKSLEDRDEAIKKLEEMIANLKSDNEELQKELDSLDIVENGEG